MSQDDPVLSTLFAREVDPSDRAAVDQLLEEYKLFVGTSEALVSRRQTANAFFFSITSVLLGIVGLVPRAGLSGAADWLLLIPLGVTGIPLCSAWHRLICSYRQLNEGKFKVIELLEKKLPARVFTAEWKALGEGRDPNRYKPFISSELWIPWLFGAIFALLVVTGVCGTVWSGAIRCPSSPSAAHPSK